MTMRAIDAADQPHVVSFRQRVLTLADEHEALLAKHLALLSENQALLSRTNHVQASMEDTCIAFADKTSSCSLRTLHLPPTDASGKFVSSTQPPSHMREGTGISTTSGQNHMREVTGISTISSQPETLFTGGIRENNRINTLDAGEGSNSDDYGNDGEQKCSNLARHVPHENIVLANAIPSEKSHVWTTNAGSVNGRNLRLRVMKHLGLIDASYGDIIGDDSADLSANSHSHEDGHVCERLRNIISDLWIKFMRMDAAGLGEICSQTLEMHLRGDSAKRISQRNGLTFEPMIKRINVATGYVSSDASPRSSTQITFAVFVEMMLMENVEEILDADDVEKINLLRRQFLAGSVTAEVAAMTKVNMETLTAKGREGCVCQMDAVVGIVIVFNAVIIGIRADVEPSWKGWIYLEACFTVFFFFELVIKMVSKKSVKAFCCGEDCMWNIFDTLLVLIALVDLVIELSHTPTDLRGVTVLRLLRLFRLSRVVRLLRIRMFKELLLMIKGIFFGLRTLFWAITLLLGLIYCIGIALKQTLGQDKFPGCQAQNTTSSSCPQAHYKLYRFRDELFSTVFRSMFTVFRCFLDGCSAPDGVPLMPLIWQVYGWWSVIFYVLGMLFVTFGLFNLTMAIFVENTLEAAKFDEARRQQFRRQEYIRGARMLNDLMLEFCKSFSTDKTETAVMEINQEMFDTVVSNPTVAQLMENLDIVVPNKKDLFEVLDADQSGFVDLKELVHGLMKLRGTASKTDAVATLLGIRAVQKSVRQLEIFVMRQVTGMKRSVLKIETLLGDVVDELRNISAPNGKLDRRVFML